MEKRQNFICQCSPVICERYQELMNPNPTKKHYSDAQLRLCRETAGIVYWFPHFISLLICFIFRAFRSSTGSCQTGRVDVRKLHTWQRDSAAFWPGLSPSFRILHCDHNTTEQPQRRKVASFSRDSWFISSPSVRFQVRVRAGAK